MSIVKAISSSNALANLRYLIDTPAHNQSLTSHRSLRYYGRNVDVDYQRHVNAVYTAMQFRAVREQARNPNKRTQAQHLIFSFSPEEFTPTQELLGEQSKQAGQLVAGYMSQRLPEDSQYLIAVQCDSKGHNLHCHVVINSVLLSGKVLDTNLVSLTKQNGLRAGFDQYMADHYPKLTGKAWEPVQPTDKTNRVHASAQKIEERGGYVWREDLKGRLIQAMQETDNLQDYVAVLETLGVSVKTRRASTGKDETGHKLYRQAYTYSMTGDDGKTHASRDFAHTKHGGIKGLGEMFTPDAIEEYYQSRVVEQQPQQPTHPQLTLDEEEDDYYADQARKSTVEQQQQPEYQGATDTNDLTEAIKSIKYDTYDTSASKARLVDRKNRQAQRQRQRDQRKRQQRERAEQASVDRPRPSTPSQSTQPASRSGYARDAEGPDR